MKLCQFYRTADARAKDLQRRIPIEAALGILVDGSILDVTERAARHHDIRSAQYAGVLTAYVAMAEEWAAFRREIQQISGRERIAPESVFFGPCVLRPCQFLDFYAFEQHVKTMRKSRGFDFIVPEWYEIPA